MNYKAVEQSDLKISEIGMGCSSLGRSLYHRDEKESLATLLKAFDSGVTFFDTSPTYSQGQSENLIGKALKGKREHIIIASKAGASSTYIGKLTKTIKPMLKPVNFMFRPIRSKLHLFYKSQKRMNFSKEYIIKSIEGSLKRLQTDYIDLIQLHHPTASILESGDFCEIFELIRTQGKIRYYGVSCDSVDDALICLKHPGISWIQVVINLIQQEAIKQLLPLANEKKICVIARLPFAQGLLTASEKETKAEQWARNRQEFSERMKRAECYRFLIKANRSMAQAALQFVLQLKGVAVAIPGFNNRRHLEEILGTLNAPPLTKEELSKISSMNA